MATTEQELIDIYPEVYDYDYGKEVKKKKRTKKKKTPAKAGCPAGYIENKFGQCLHPEILKINKSVKELEKQADQLEKAWEEAKDFSTGRIPFAGKTERLNLVGRLLDENIDDLKNIKRWFFW